MAVSQSSFDLEFDDGGDPTFSVKELTDVVNGMFRRAFTDGVWVRGEIEGMTTNRNGHVYFTISERSAALMDSIQCIAFPSRMDVQRLAEPAAIRVVSRNPVPVNGSKSSATLPLITAAMTCGRWLVKARMRSCSSGDICRTVMPIDCQNRTTRSVATTVAFDGVTTHTRSTNKSASACSKPVRSLPAIGCDPTNRSAAWSLNPAKILDFTLPASVISSQSASVSWPTAVAI